MRTLRRRDLRRTATAVICSFECTFCADCGAQMEHVCPNCGGELVARPKRIGMSGVRHLYVHLPFCAHRCGYCDFVTAVGRREQHSAYVDALLRELDEERHVLADEVETVFLGGGTPTFTALPELVRLLEALPPAEEVTVEANPETVTPDLASRSRGRGRHACLPRRAVVPAAPAATSSSAARNPTTSAVRSRTCATPASTTSRST